MIYKRILPFAILFTISSPFLFAGDPATVGQNGTYYIKTVVDNANSCEITNLSWPGGTNTGYDSVGAAVAKSTGPWSASGFAPGTYPYRLSCWSDHHVREIFDTAILTVTQGPPTTTTVSFSPTSGALNTTTRLSFGGDRNPTSYMWSIVSGANTACTPTSSIVSSFIDLTAAQQGWTVGNTYKACAWACNATGCDSTTPAPSATYQVTNVQVQVQFSFLDLLERFKSLIVLPVSAATIALP